ncbi:MAG TPA: PilW family protein [Gammaproteobacteria bacterium]|nr:PilW family protein [Gammaproteobacteria bacterium]
MVPLHIKKPRHAQRGLSLVEVMVGVTISLLLLAGVIQLFVSSKQGYQVIQSSGRMQENARYAVMLLGNSLRMADNWGGIDGDDVTVDGALAITGTGTCTEAWIADPGTGIQGFEGGGVPPACIPAADYVADSDAFVVRYAAAEGMVADADLNTVTNASNVFVRVTIGARGFLFNGSGVGNIPSDLLAPTATATNTYNFPYMTELYFVRPCSVKSGATCAATDDGGRPIPTLVRYTLQGNAFVEQPLVDGVEQMQIEYGIDTDGDRSADQFFTADAIADWDTVVAVRYGLLMRGDELDVATPDLENMTFTMPGSYTFSPPAGVENRYQRKLFVDTVQLRNRTR